MNKNYSIEDLDGITIIRFIKPPSYDDICKVVDELTISQPQLRLWDLSSGANLSTDKLIKIAELGKLKLIASSTKVAIVAPSDLAFGLARVHQVYREQENFEEIVFRSEKEAIDWLKSKNA